MVVPWPVWAGVWATECDGNGEMVAAACGVTVSLPHLADRTTGATASPGRPDSAARRSVRRPLVCDGFYYAPGSTDTCSAPQGELLSSLDSQINQLRSEMQTLYRTQAAAQNKQLAMADALRDRDEEVRGLREEVRELRDARDSGARRERNLEERYKMREEDVKVSRPGANLYSVTTPLTAHTPDPPRRNPRVPD